MKKSSSVIFITECSPVKQVFVEAGQVPFITFNDRITTKPEAIEKLTSQNLKELEEMLERQIKRRDKEVFHYGIASKKVSNQISRTKMLMRIEVSKLEREQKNK
jgi:hypothetical protein